MSWHYGCTPLGHLQDYKKQWCQRRSFTKCKNKYGAELRNIQPLRAVSFSTALLGQGWFGCSKQKLLNQQPGIASFGLQNEAFLICWTQYWLENDAGWARVDEIDRGREREREREREGERIFQHKVSYATLLLVLLQVTNYCILISMQPETRRGRRRVEGGGKKGGGREKTEEMKSGEEEDGGRNTK